MLEPVADPVDVGNCWYGITFVCEKSAAQGRRNKSKQQKIRW